MHGSEVARAGDVMFLDQHIMKERVLIVFGDHVGGYQHSLFSDYSLYYSDALRERDMTLYFISTLETSFGAFGPSEITLADWDYNKHLMIEAYNPDFIDGRTVLIGKDGDVKGAWDSPPDIQQVFAVIDEMPMRIREMNENHSQK